MRLRSSFVLAIAAFAAIAAVVAACDDDSGTAPTLAPGTSLTPLAIEDQNGIVERIEVLREGGAGDAIPLWVEVPTDSAGFARGLMRRPPLPDDRGMVFVMIEREFCSFWMKDTPSPLSIAFTDDRGVILDIQDMEPFDLTTHFPPEGECAYALEVAQGWFERQDVEIGDRLKFPWPYDAPPPYPDDE